jgi:hypothetical protein
MRILLLLLLLARAGANELSNVQVLLCIGVALPVEDADKACTVDSPRAVRSKSNLMLMLLRQR